MSVFKYLFWAQLALLCSGCAFMHHTQIGDVDSDIVLKGQKFEILLSETGVNIKEAANIGKAMTRHKGTQNQIQQIQQIISMFQMGPRTGNMVFSEDYADSVFQHIRTKCPSGKISGLMSIRESAKYPVVSGEIIKVIGYCSEG